MVAIQCDICKDSFSLHHFRFLQCGHGFCETCTAHTRNQRTCAVCRQPKGEPHPIFITLAEPAASSDGDVSLARDDAGSGQMGLLIPSIQKDIRRLKGKAKRVDSESGEGLIELTEKLERRVAALFTELESQSISKCTLETRNRVLEQTMTKGEQLQAEVSRLQHSLRQAEQECLYERSLFDGALVRCRKQEEENTRLTQTVEIQRRTMEKKDTEIRELHAAAEAKEKEIRLVKQKLRVLAKLNKRDKVPTQDPDESLLVEAPGDVYNLLSKHHPNRIENDEKKPEMYKHSHFAKTIYRNTSLLFSRGGGEEEIRVKKNDVLRTAQPLRGILKNGGVEEEIRLKQNDVCRTAQPLRGILKKG